MNDSTAKKIAGRTWGLAGLAPWYALAVLLIAYALSFLDRVLLSFLIAPVKEDLGLSDTGISLLLGFAFALFYAVMGFPLGWLADRGNRQKLVAAGITVWTVMTAACGLAQSFWTLFAARMGVGVGEAALTPAAYSMLSDYFPRERLARVLAIYSIGVPLGSGIAIWLGGAVVEFAEHFTHIELPFFGFLAPWRWAFIMVGVTGIAVTLLMLTVREPARRVHAGAVAADHGSMAEFMRFLRQNARLFVPYFGGLSLFVLVLYGYLLWTPTFFARTYDMSMREIGTIYGIIQAVCGAGGLLLGGFAADHMFGRGRPNAHLLTILGAMAFYWPSAVLLPLMGSQGWAFIALIPATIMASLWGGVAPAAVQLVTPAHMRARMSALYLFIVNIVGLGLGPTVIATVTDYVLADEGALRYAMAIVSGVTVPLGAAIFCFSLRPFREALKRASARSA